MTRSDPQFGLLAGGVTDWWPMPDVFPSGMTDWLGLPLSLYSSSYSGDNIYNSTARYLLRGTKMNGTVIRGRLRSIGITNFFPE